MLVIEVIVDIYEMMVKLAHSCSYLAVDKSFQPLS